MKDKINQVQVGVVQEVAVATREGKSARRARRAQERRIADADPDKRKTPASGTSRLRNGNGQDHGPATRATTHSEKGRKNAVGSRRHNNSH